MRHRRGTGQGQAGDHRQDGGKGHGRDEAHEHVAANRMANQHRGHVLATLQATGDRVQVFGVGQHQGDRTEADDEDQQVEVADPGGGPQHRLARFLGIGNGEEAHQDVRQAGGTEHQRHAEGDRTDRVLEEAARAHYRLADGSGLFGAGAAVGGQLGLDLDRAGEQLFKAEVVLPHHCHGHEGDAEQQQGGLDDLHPGGGGHATEQHVDHHQDADHHHRDPVLQAEQQLDQRTGTDHLRDQVEGHHHQRAGGRKATDRGGGKAVTDHVGEGEAAQVAHALGQQEGQDRPADNEADGIDQAIETGQHHHRGDAQEGRGGHEVAGDRQAILEAGDAATAGVEIAGRTGPPGGPLGDAQGGQHEGGEHDDRRPVGRLAFGLAEITTGRQGQAAETEQAQRGRNTE